MRVKINDRALKGVLAGREVVDHLRGRAESVASSASADKPSWLKRPVFAVAGVNREGQAYAQAIARESGAVYAEFYRKPFLRPALDRQRGR